MKCLCCILFLSLFVTEFICEKKHWTEVLLIGSASIERASCPTSLKALSPEAPWCCEQPSRNFQCSLSLWTSWQSQVFATVHLAQEGNLFREAEGGVDLGRCGMTINRVHPILPPIWFVTCPVRYQKPIASPRIIHSEICFIIISPSFIRLW